MNRRPILASTAAVAALALCSAGSGAAAATAKPAAGQASSVLSLLTATAGGHVIRVGDLSLLSDTLSGSALSRIVVTPLTADGTTIGQQVITPSSPAADVPAETTPSALAGVLSLSSPAFSTSATNAPAAHAGAASLGTVSLLGLPVPLSGAVDLGSSVSSVTGALGAKTVSLTNLALPSIAALLAALGLDVSKLPVPTLTALVQQLGLVTSALSTAEATASAALAQVSAATTTVGTATTSLTQATAGVTAATASLTTATDALQSLLSTVPAATLLTLPGANTVAGFLALPALSQAVVEGVVPGLASALTTFQSAQSALTAAQGVLTTATAALAAAQALLDGLLATLQSALAPVLALLTSILDSTPLVSLDSLTLSSKAAATSAKTGGQQAQVLGGDITGLHVLGTDVLDSVLGTSSLSLVGLTSGTLAAVTTAISGLTGTLSSVLSTVPGFPKLSIPAPKVDLLTTSKATSISGGFGRALTTVQGLKITLPAITLPTSLALPGAASLPALGGVTQTVAGLLTSAPVSLGLLSLSDQAAFSPAVLASTPTTVTPPTVPVTPSTPTAELPHTGLPVGLAVLSFVLIGGALVVRRRAAGTE